MKKLKLILLTIFSIILVLNKDLLTLGLLMMMFSQFGWIDYILENSNNFKFKKLFIKGFKR